MYPPAFIESLNNISPVKVAALKSVNEHLGGGYVGSYGDIVHVAKAQHVHIVSLVWLLIERVAEEQQHVDFIARYTRGDLLAAALRARQELLDSKACCLRYHFARGAGGAKIVAAQNSAVCNTKLNHKLFLFVVCY